MVRRCEERACRIRILARSVLQDLRNTLSADKVTGQAVSPQWQCLFFFCDCNYILFTKLPWPGDNEGTFRSSSQAATCPPVYHTRRRLRTVPSIVEHQAVNTDVYSPWFDPTGNRTRVYRFSSRRSIHSTTDRFGRAKIVVGNFGRPHQAIQRYFKSFSTIYDVQHCIILPFSAAASSVHEHPKNVFF